MTGHCELCNVECELTRHHLIPQLKAKNKYASIKNADSDIIMICRQCHDMIHATFNESELRDFYCTKDALLSSEKIAKFVSWRKKHPEFNGHAKMTNDRRH